MTLVLLIFAFVVYRRRKPDRVVVLSCVGFDA